MSLKVLPHLTEGPNVPPPPKSEEKSLREQYMESQKNAFFREVEEDVKAEKVAVFWNKYKRYIIGAIVVVLSCSIAFNWYESYRNAVVHEEAKRFERIVSDTTITSAEKISELKSFADDAKFGYKDVAYFNAYSLEVDAGKYEDAISTLEKLISDSTDKSFENLASVKLAGIVSSVNNTDLEKVKDRLSDIGKNKPLFATAQFILGTIYVKENKFKEAKEIFDKLTDDESLPVSLKSEGLTMLNFVKSNMAK